MIVMSAKIDFKSETIQKAAEKSKPKTLARMGAYVQGIAKRLIKRRKKKSLPGNPPHTQTGVLKKSILFALTGDKQTALIGPAANWIGKIGALHEFGGSKRVKVPQKMFMRELKIGEGGPLSSRKFQGKKIPVGEQYLTDPYDGSPIVFAKIRTQKQLEHSRRLQKRLACKYSVVRTANYPARPFMRPALDIAVKGFPAMLRKSISA